DEEVAAAEPLEDDAATAREANLVEAGEGPGHLALGHVLEERRAGQSGDGAGRRRVLRYPLRGLSQHLLGPVGPDPVSGHLHWGNFLLLIGSLVGQPTNSKSRAHSYSTARFPAALREGGGRRGRSPPDRRGSRSPARGRSTSASPRRSPTPGGPRPRQR